MDDSLRNRRARTDSLPIPTSGECMNDADQPLQGTLVLDLSVTIPGPYATALLQRMGARVIKAEPPAGDMTRIFPGMHAALNRGKETIVANLKTAPDVAMVRAIASRADVVVEGWRPGVADRLGIGMTTLRTANPALVTCSISGWGGKGPMRDRAGHDLNYLAEAGALRLAHGEHAPVNLNIPIADLVGGTFAAMRICAALVTARTTGRGSHIDTSLAGAARDWVEALGGAEHPSPMASLDALPHYGVFETADGHALTIGIVNEDHFWRALCGLLGMDADAGLSFGERGAQAARLRGELRQRIAARTRDALEPALRAIDTCWAFADASPGSRDITGMLPPSIGDDPALGTSTDAVRAEFTAADQQR